MRCWPMILATATLAGLMALAPQQDQPAPDAPKTGLRFESIDVFIDAGATPLAAWQVEVKPAGDQPGHVKIVGIEGGQHPAYAAAPYYDPIAMQGERVIIAGLSTADDLPMGRTRVARIHVQVDAPDIQWQASLQAAAGPDGAKFEAIVEVVAAHQGEGK